MYVRSTYTFGAESDLRMSKNFWKEFNWFEFNRICITGKQTARVKQAEADGIRPNITDC